MSLFSRVWVLASRVLIPVLILFSPLLLATDLDSISRENLRQGVTEISRDVYGLHNFVIWVCVGIAVIVYGVLIYSLFAYRHSKGAKAATFSHSMKAEVIWTLVPVILLVVMAVPTIKVLAKMYDSSNSEIDILVTGYQWKWSYEYLDEGVKFFSSMTGEDEQKNPIRQQMIAKAPKDKTYLLNVDNPLVIPIDTKVRFLVTANDVLHSWWVPDFAVKRDAVPGYINESWAIVEEPGIYRGQCAELCGKDHGFMPVVVEAVSKDEYQSWLATKKAEVSDKANEVNKVWHEDDLLAIGKKVYATNCVACHQVSGQGNPPIFPALAASPKVTGDKSVTLDTLINGVPGTAMQAFGKQLDDIEIAAVVSYIRSSWGNDPAQRVVFPREVTAAR